MVFVNMDRKDKLLDIGLLDVFFVSAEDRSAMFFEVDPIPSVVHDFICES